MSVADEVKARLDLVAYIEESVPLQKAGRTYKACCPFHQERTPSFVVFPETQTWRCFGACAEGGDIFSFAMKQNGWDFKEALRHLAERAGVELEERSPQQAQQDAQFERLLGVLNETATFFNRLFKEAPGAEIA
ncbi:MAG: DNA primase, partial [Anaerolineae bacterium]|nr:DNA primase [Anaerolineae bacterium]